MDQLMTWLTILGIVGMVFKVVGTKVKERLEQGALERIHFDTFYKRLRHREPHAKEADRRKRRSPLRRAQGKPAVVLSFEGDSKASDRDDFARRADEVVENITRIGKVIVHIESMGGRVSEYGIVFSHMERIRQACDRVGIELVACLGTGAASGGYLAAVPAHRILSPEMSIAGSIGVVVQFLNFNAFLETWGIDAHVWTAGPLKRTITTIGKITSEAEEHVLGQLKKMHEKFIEKVTFYRPSIDVARACSGDHFLGDEARELFLVDKLITYEAFVLDVNKETDLVYIGSRPNKKLPQLIAQLFGMSLAHAGAQLIDRLSPKL